MARAITIPRELARKDDLIVIPRKEYEELLKLRKIVPLVKLTPAQKRDLEQARKEYARGEYITLERLERELGITAKKAR